MRTTETKRPKGRRYRTPRKKTRLRKTIRRRTSDEGGAEGRDPDSTTVRDVASTDIVTVDPEQDLAEALRLMAEHQVRRLPVVEEDGRVVGIVAQADVARQADDRKTGDVVERISQ